MGDAKHLDEVDFQVIVALAIGKTQDESGAWVSTPSHPAGLSGRAVRTRITSKKSAYDRNLSKIAAELSRRQQDFEELTKAKYLEKLAKLRSKGLAVQERALDQGLSGAGDLSLAVQVAGRIEDRDFGRPSQVHKVEGNVEVNHKMIWQPRRVLIGQEEDIEASDRLLSAIPRDAIEAELVGN